MAAQETVGDLYRAGIEILDALGASEARRNVYWMLEKITDSSMVSLMANKKQSVTEFQAAQFYQQIHRRASGEPVQYIVQEAPFRGMMLYVDNRVLIPRPETEMLVDLVIDDIDGKPCRLLDIGTGSGCIAIACKKEIPQLSVTAIDVSAGAIEVASRNAIAEEVDVEFEVVDMFSTQIDALGKFDIVVSNPPYIPASELGQLSVEVGCYEPGQALEAGKDGLDFYKRIAEKGKDLVCSEGKVLVEIHEYSGAAVVSLFEAAGFCGVSTTQDLAGRDRFVIARTPR